MIIISNEQNWDIEKLINNVFSEEAKIVEDEEVSSKHFYNYKSKDKTKVSGEIGFCGEYVIIYAPYFLRYILSTDITISIGELWELLQKPEQIIIVEWGDSNSPSGILNFSKGKFKRCLSYEEQDVLLDIGKKYEIELEFLNNSFPEYKPDQENLIDYSIRLLNNIDLKNEITTKRPAHVIPEYSKKLLEIIINQKIDRYNIFPQGFKNFTYPFKEIQEKSLYLKFKANKFDELTCYTLIEKENSITLDEALVKTVFGTSAQVIEKDEKFNFLAALNYHKPGYGMIAKTSNHLIICDHLFPFQFFNQKNEVAYKLLDIIGANKIAISVVGEFWNQGYAIFENNTCKRIRYSAEKKPEQRAYKKEVTNFGKETKLERQTKSTLFKLYYSDVEHFLIRYCSKEIIKKEFGFYPHYLFHHLIDDYILFKYDPADSNFFNWEK